MEDLAKKNSFLGSNFHLHGYGHWMCVWTSEREIWLFTKVYEGLAVYKILLKLPRNMAVNSNQPIKALDIKQVIMKVQKKKLEEYL